MKYLFTKYKKPRYLEELNLILNLILFFGPPLFYFQSLKFQIKNPKTNKKKTLKTSMRLKHVSTYFERPLIPSFMFDLIKAIPPVGI